MKAKMVGKDSLVASSEPADLKNCWSGLLPATGVEIAVYGRGAPAPFWLQALIACFRVLSRMEEAPPCRAVITDISAKFLKLCLINEHASGSSWHSFHFPPWLSAICHVLKVAQQNFSYATAQEFFFLFFFLIMTNLESTEAVKKLTD